MKEVIDLTEYAQWTETTAQYPKDKEFEYLVLGLLSEIGEVAGVEKRIIRGDKEPGDLRAEIGDVLWYLGRLHIVAGIPFHLKFYPYTLSTYGALAKLFINAAGLLNEGQLNMEIRLALLSNELYGFAYDHGFDITEIAKENQGKLMKRLEDGVIKGKGDQR